MRESDLNGKNAKSNPCADESKNTLLSCFFSLPPKQFALLASIIGILLVDNLDLDQQNSLGNFIVSVGSTILAAAAQGSTLKSSNQQNERIREQIRMLKKQIRSLEEELDG